MTTTPALPHPTDRSRAAVAALQPSGEHGPELLWPPLTTWQLRDDPVGFDETEDEIDHWVYEID